MPEGTTSFQDVRTAHKRLRKVVRQQSRELIEAAERERRMREQIQGLPERGLKAYAEIIRTRSDLTMSEALSLVAEVFSADD